jgi:hypothetical protein
MYAMLGHDLIQYTKFVLKVKVEQFLYISGEGLRALTG